MASNIRINQFLLVCLLSFPSILMTYIFISLCLTYNPIESDLQTFARISPIRQDLSGDFLLEYIHLWQITIKMKLLDRFTITISQWSTTQQNIRTTNQKIVYIQITYGFAWIPYGRHNNNCQNNSCPLNLKIQMVFFLLIFKNRIFGI